jgi:hypothetical protein
MWFWVWTLLIVGSLVGAFFLARYLWRSAKGLMEELGRASARLAESSERLQELSDRAREAAATQHAGPSLFDDVTIHYQRVDAQRAARGRGGSTSTTEARGSVRFRGCRYLPSTAGLPLWPPGPRRIGHIRTAPRISTAS